MENVPNILVELQEDDNNQIKFYIERLHEIREFFIHELINDCNDKNLLIDYIIHLTNVADTFADLSSVA